MKRAVAATAAVCVAMGVAAAGIASGADLKVGIVDMARVFNAYPETRTADDAIEKQVQEFDAERKQMLEDLQKLKDDFDAARKDAANKAWSDEVRREKEALLETKYNALRDQDQKHRETAEFRQKQIADQRARLRERILGKLQNVLGEYAAKNGLTLILDRSETSASRVPAVLYSASDMDITADILKLTGGDKTPAGEDAKP